MRGVVIGVLAGLVACCFAAVPSVVRFSIRDELVKKPRLGSWSFKACDDTKKGSFVVNNLDIGPDPLVFPGPLSVAFSVNVVGSTVKSPLKADVTLAKQVGSVWVKIPCIGKIGSCSYDDLCDILSGIDSCPGPFVDNKVPCKCPFDQGNYTLPKSNFDVETAIFPAGNYKGSAVLSMNNNFVGCYNLTATFG